MKRIQLSATAALAVVALAAVACGQPLTTAEETQTAQAAVTVAVTPPTTDTPEMTATTTPAPVPTPASPPQILAAATPAFITPVALGASAARTDCPAGWSTFSNTSETISACAPEAAVAVGDVTETGEPGLTVASDVGGVFSKDLPEFAVAARISSIPNSPPTADMSSYCVTTVGGSAAVTFQTTAGVAAGCDATIEPNAPNGPLRTLRLTLKLAAPTFGFEFLNFDVNWRVESAGAEEMARGIAATLRVQP